MEAVFISRQEAERATASLELWVRIPFHVWTWMRVSVAFMSREHVSLYVYLGPSQQ